MNKKYIDTFGHRKIFISLAKNSQKIYSKYFTIIYSSYLNVCKTLSITDVYPLVYTKRMYYVAIKVTKKSQKKAVCRNKIKRRIKHSLASIIKEDLVPKKHGFMIVIPKSIISNAKYLDIKYDLTKSIQKLVYKSTYNAVRQTNHNLKKAL